MLFHTPTVYHQVERRLGHRPGGGWLHRQALGDERGQERPRGRRARKSPFLEPLGPGELTPVIRPLAAAPEARQPLPR